MLPGVTVEASSTALIERVRTAVTDAQGRYSIVDLRVGTYSVTFRLAGFGTVSRTGIELTAGFTATVNAELPIGSVQETITVTGTSAADVGTLFRYSAADDQYIFNLDTGNLTVGRTYRVRATLMDGQTIDGFIYVIR